MVVLVVHKKNLVILDYRSWLIEVDECFPSVNYIVRKKGNAHCAYCNSLEEGLKQIFSMTLLSNINEKKDYGRTLEELCKVVIQTKNEFALLFDANDLLKNSYKIVKKQKPCVEGDSSC